MKRIKFIRGENRNNKKKSSTKTTVFFFIAFHLICVTDAADLLAKQSRREMKQQREMGKKFWDNHSVYYYIFLLPKFELCFSDKWFLCPLAQFPLALTSTLHLLHSHTLSMSFTHSLSFALQTFLIDFKFSLFPSFYLPFAFHNTLE